MNGIIEQNDPIIPNFFNNLQRLQLLHLLGNLGKLSV